jgi:hypothetical protein
MQYEDGLNTEQKASLEAAKAAERVNASINEAFGKYGEFLRNQMVKEKQEALSK